MANFQAIYERLCYMYSPVADIPARQAVLFAEIIEHSATYDDEEGSFHSDCSTGGEIKKDEIVALTAYQKICNLFYLEPDLRSAYLAMAMGAIVMRGFNFYFYNHYVPFAQNIRQYTEALCVLNRNIGKDLAFITCKYVWFPTIKNEAIRSIALTETPKFMLFGWRYRKYISFTKDRYIADIKKEFPAIDLSNRQIVKFFTLCAPYGAFISNAGWHRVMGLYLHNEELDSICELLESVGL